jgi:cytoskeleton protein RodZ
MSDAVSASAAAVPPRPTTAGGMLRHARQAQGLHIAALAAAIKVVPRKLELLESDQFDQLPDATFTRALAQAVCRTLKIDPTPILALMPPPLGHRLEQVAQGLNAPFRERPGRLEPSEWTSVSIPALALVALLLILAAAVYLMPAGWLKWPRTALTPAASAPVAASAAVTETILMPPVSAASAAAPVEVAPAAVASEAALAPDVPGVLQLRPSEAAWVEVIDARGKPLIARLVQPGESVGLDGVMPFKVRIGNANAMQAVFRGQPLELGPFIRDNIAKLELK